MTRSLEDLLRRRSRKGTRIWTTAKVLERVARELFRGEDVVTVDQYEGWLQGRLSSTLYSIKLRRGLGHMYIEYASD